MLAWYYAEMKQWLSASLHRVFFLLSDQTNLYDDHRSWLLVVQVDSILWSLQLICESDSFYQIQVVFFHLLSFLIIIVII